MSKQSHARVTDEGDLARKQEAQPMRQRKTVTPPKPAAAPRAANRHASNAARAVRSAAKASAPPAPHQALDPVMDRVAEAANATQPPTFPSTRAQYEQEWGGREKRWELLYRLQRLERARPLTEGELEWGFELCVGLSWELHELRDCFGGLVLLALNQGDTQIWKAVQAFYEELPMHEREYLAQTLKGHTSFVDEFLAESEETSDRVQDLRDELNR